MIFKFIMKSRKVLDLFSMKENVKLSKPRIVYTRKLEKLVKWQQFENNLKE